MREIFKKIFKASMTTGLFLAAAVLFNAPTWGKEAPKTTVTAKKGAKSQGQVVKPGEIKIPPEYGRVIETFDSGGNLLIVHLQDAHTNYEAQKNAAAILEYLINKNGLYLIFVEGGSRDVSLNQYREKAPLEERKRTADESLRQGIIAGEEYLNIASDYPMKLQGIEDRPLYDRNMTAYLEVDKYKDEALSLTKQLTGVVTNLKIKMYSKALKELDDKRIAFKEEKVGLNDYVQYLSDLAKAKKVNIAAYPNYKNLIDTVELEKAIDFNEVEKERAEVIDVLSKKFSQADLNELLSKSVDFKAGKLTPAQYHNYLKDAMQKAKINLGKYPNLEKYIKYITIYEKIESAALFKELKALEEIVEQTLISGEDQKRLARIAKDLGLLIEFINLKLAPDDFDYYQANEGNFNIAVWVRFLNTQAIKYKLTQKAPEDVSPIDKVIPSLKDFYTIARKRDEIFLNNTIKYAKLEKVAIAALIAGGFHTPSLTQLFRFNNISYVVVSPKVIKPTDEKLYHKILTEGWAPTTESNTEAGKKK